MVYLEGLFAFVIFQIVVSLSDVNNACFKKYSVDLNNDFLIGTWYEVYKFSKVLNLPATAICFEYVIRKPSQEDVQRYIDAYKLDNPFSFEDNPVVFDTNRTRYRSMLLGNKEAKFYVFDPKSVFFGEDYYEAWVYEKVNEDFVLFQKCFLRGNTKWLLSRRKNVTDEEIADVIKNIQSKVKRYETQRFCAL